MPVLSLSLRHARHLQLAAQGVLRPVRRKACFDDLNAVIRRMSLLQIDSINVVARSPYLVLFSRLGDYPPHWLDEALSGGRLFEYWAHEACFISIEDYALFRHRMLNPRLPGWKYDTEWIAAWQHEISALLDHIARNGPVKSADFSAPSGQKPGWWAWKPQKRHLENLFSAGELMVKERQNFQRVYDLRQNIMPEWNDVLHTLDEAAAIEQMLCNSAAGLRIFRPQWLAGYYRLKNALVKEILCHWLESGEIVRVDAEKMGECYLYQPQSTDPESTLHDTYTALLSTFDPLIWDRRRARELFDFDYRLECYTPEGRRQYGYFVLPVLHRGALRGWLDAKMLRKEKTLLIKQFWLQPEVKIGQRLLDDVCLAVIRFARWQGAESVLLEKRNDALAEAWHKSWAV
ncbi:winged helix DNA-binding domain-containing protein [Erwinia tracheiphila]|uniref:Winged helix-turn-helix domain-containing protein n=1 Tax=Erwinia tracheiphila TaxID=65700 RepID=A0A345CRZ6_9GAMM|nr:crosslink repair DNA glycosylase YcaQ family protein [Erwinia tracheiphila]AXF76213.1 winged helix-turn-helix domain-containing protein [Erwinia tracheiphila]UIA85122.1 winged helix DNA-binding domain-containing protein [Erwinia tracheiphila]UIA93723.1 winged helix DNA-binding domain-containing protein [Erwinia tracheiphila]